MFYQITYDGPARSSRCLDIPKFGHLTPFFQVTEKSALSKLKRLPLSFRREIIDLTFFLKCKLELCDLNFYNFVVFNSTFQNRPTTGSSADPLLLILKRCKTESHRASF